MAYYNEARNKADQRYKASHIKRIPLDVQLEDYEQIKAAADRAGQKVNTYIKEAIKMRMEKEESPE